MGVMRATAGKSSTTASTTAHASKQQSFLSPAKGGDFFPRVQTKLTVNKPGDKFEQEADKTADKVMRMATPAGSGGTDKLQRQPEDKVQRREEEKILRAAKPQDKIQRAGADEPMVQRRQEEKILRAAAPEDKIQKADDPKLQKADDPRIQKADDPQLQKAEAPHRAEEKILRVADDRLQKKDQEIQKAAQPDDKIQKAEENKLQKAPATDEKLQREAAAGGGTPAASSHVQSSLNSQMTGGEPLGSDVRGYMEPRFNADFDDVRVHHDAEAASLSNHLSARAFTHQNHVFFARGQYQPETGDGKHLLAHELTHTIQQGHAVQRAPQISTTAATPAVQRLGIQDALDKFAEWAYAIPGFRLLTLIIGFNPINMRSADRNAANILRGLIELMPGGSIVTQVLDNYGITNKAAAWIEAKLAELGDIAGDLAGALKTFLDSLSWTDIFDLGGVWDRAKRIFTEPIAHLISFAGSTVIELLKMAKDAALKPLAAMAKGTRGYDLLCVLLGADPISNEPVPPTAENLLGGFMKLIGQEEIWDNIKKGNAIARAYAWFQTALSGLMGMVRAIPGKIVATISSLSFTDIVTIAGAFGKVVTTFVSIAGDFISWGLSTIWDLLKIIIDVVKPGLMGYIQKTGTALKGILKNPMPFLGNLVSAAKLGFTNFGANFGEHLKAGIIDWLTGSLEGVYIPKAVSLLELGKFALSVLGITWPQIRGKIVAALGPSGEKIMQGLEIAFDLVKALVTGGIGAVWDLIKEKLSDLKDQVISGIISLITTTVVTKAVPKLIGMFIPGAGFIPAIISIYDTVMVFVDKLAKIAQVVKSFIDSIVEIAGGNIGGAAARVESSLAGILSLAISFLAGFLGLGKITDKIMAVVQQVRAKVDAAIGAAITWIVTKAKSLFASLFSKKDKPDDRTEEQKTQAKRAAIAEAEKLVPEKGFDEAKVQGQLGPIKSNYKLLTLNLVVDSKQDKTETIHFTASASDEEVGQPKQVTIAGELNQVTLASAFTARDKPAAGKKLAMTRDEMRRQVAIQEAALNKLDVTTWKSNWEKFYAPDGGRDDEAGAREDRLLAIQAEKGNSMAQWKANNPGKADDEGRAFIARLYAPDPGNKAYPFLNKSLDYGGITYINGAYGKAILHAADQGVGGGTETAGLGGSRENSSIGAQWDRGGRAKALKELLDIEITKAGATASPEDVGKMKLKVVLPVQDG